jgi:hypothetical protein
VFLAVFFVLGVRVLVTSGFFGKPSAAADAEVVQVITSRDSDGNVTYVPVVRFLDASGIEHTVRSSVATSNVEIGTKTLVFYEPEHVERDFVIELAMWPSLMTGSIFVIISLIGFCGVFGLPSLLKRGSSN